MCVIRTKQDFLNEISIGQTFWIVRTLNLAPQRIDGPYTVMEFTDTFSNGTEGPHGIVVKTSDGEAEKSINDLFTNKYKAVALTEAEAKAFLICAKIHFKNDHDGQLLSGLQEELDRLIDDDDFLDDLDRLYDDGDFFDPAD